MNADAVVVGAGTAGSVVAGRLASRGDRQVVVVEAGPDYGPHGSDGWPPELLDASTLPTSHDWGYEGPAADGRRIPFERARVVGGCSTHNGCTQSWGWSGDYDRWAAEGLHGWSAADLAPLFEEASRRMRVRRYDEHEVQPFQAAFVAACEGAGIAGRPDLDDLDGGAGVDVAPVNIVDGIRWNVSFAYLDPERGRHLEIQDRTTVRRLVLDGDRVSGLEVERHGEIRTIGCGEVVLSAGAYGTPEILMRSGIGDPGVLRGAGIEPLVDLPGVGRNLHDHASLTLEFEASPHLVELLDAFRAEHGWLPEEQAVAKVASSSAEGPYDLHLYPWVEPRAGSSTGWAVVMAIGLLTPESRGSIRIVAGQHRGTPDHAYLASSRDRAALAEGLEIAERLCAARELAPLLGSPLAPPPRDDRDAWMRRAHSHYWHPAGTAAMGDADSGGVCDADGRVHGVIGLRVADASLFPRIPRATPALPTVVVGERVAGAIP